MSIIEVKNVHKVFGPNPQSILPMIRNGATKEEVLEKTGHTVGLDDVSMSMEKGKTSVVMGLSGSGKSTLIRHLNRLIDPTDGEVIVDGTDVLKLNPEELMHFRREKTSMVFQRFGLFPHKTVLQNVGYGLEIRGLPLEDYEKSAREQIRLVGLDGYENQYPEQLSGGMQQRVGLARALATNTDIMLMDEAFSALDPLIRREMQEQLIDLQNKLHKTIVFITHDLDEALLLGDQISILNGGRLVQNGTAEDILLNPADDYVKAFVKDVNRGKVVTARSLLSDATLIFKEGDAPETVLKHLKDSGEKQALVLSEEGQLLGGVTSELLKNGVREKAKQCVEITHKIPTVNEYAVVKQILAQTIGNDWPVAVLGERGEFCGVVLRDDALRVLTAKEEK